MNGNVVFVVLDMVVSVIVCVNVAAVATCECGCDSGCSCNLACDDAAIARPQNIGTMIDDYLVDVGAGVVALGGDDLLFLALFLL